VIIITHQHAITVQVMVQWITSLHTKGEQPMYPTNYLSPGFSEMALVALLTWLFCPKQRYRMRNYIPLMGERADLSLRMPQRW